MSKLSGELSYKDWCILKHALRNQVKIKEAVVSSHEVDELYLEETEKMKKELTEEKATLERITKVTDSFKRYIKGQERYYDSRACDCE
jgi:hypothetical protein